MRRKQWGTLLLGVLSLAADCFAAGIQYLDRRYVYGNPPEGIAEMVHFFCSVWVVRSGCGGTGGASAAGIPAKIEIRQEFSARIA